MGKEHVQVTSMQRVRATGGSCMTRMRSSDRGMERRHSVAVIGINYTTYGTLARII